jgi:hypothetical protein
MVGIVKLVDRKAAELKQQEPAATDVPSFARERV